MRAFIGRLLLLVFLAGAATVLVPASWQAVLGRYAGAWTHAPEDAPWLLSDRAQRLVDSAFAGREPATPVRDMRVLALNSVSTSALESRAPLNWLAAQVRAHAAGIRNAAKAGVEYEARLMRQIEAMPGGYRINLLARDDIYGPTGQREKARSADGVPNETVMRIAGHAPETVSPVVSVHPYRGDAVAALEHWAAQGATAVSWWPIAQHIDLSDPRVAACYAAMAANGMALRLPVGAREADNGAEGWIDPSAVRKALDAGVEVVLTLGGARAKDGHALMPDVFALLRDSAYDERLSIDLAGVLSPGQIEDVLAPLLQHPQFFDRLHYASGYPQPAIAAAIRLGALVEHGFLDADLVAPLREIYDVNPLMFAFVALRNVHLPATELRLPDRVFFGESAS